jgi:hypothetical protein
MEAIKVKQSWMKTIACSVAVFLIFGTVGCTSQHDLNSVASESTVEVNAEKETIHPSSTKTLPKEHEELNISIRSVDEGVNEIKPIERGFKIDPKIGEELLRKKMEQIKPIQGLFETSLETVKADDKISIDFVLKNISGKALQLKYGSGQQFDIWVYNEQNEEVYRWSNDKAFTQALIETELSKSGQLTFNEDWNLEDNKGNPIPAGKYTIEVRVMIGLETGTISQDELTAKTFIEIE